MASEKLPDHRRRIGGPHIAHWQERPSSSAPAQHRTQLALSCPLPARPTGRGPGLSTGLRGVAAPALLPESLRWSQSPAHVSLPDHDRRAAWVAALPQCGGARGGPAGTAILLTCRGSRRPPASAAPCPFAGGSGPCGSAGGHAVSVPGCHSPVERPQVTGQATLCQQLTSAPRPRARDAGAWGPPGRAPQQGGGRRLRAARGLRERPAHSAGRQRCGRVWEPRAGGGRLLVPHPSARWNFPLSPQNPPHPRDYSSSS